MTAPINWQFPLARPHTGMMFGNGTTGLLVWGDGSRLKITIGRADFWDHRGGMSWTGKQNYHDIRRCLENNDRDGITAIFACDTEQQPGLPPRPSVIPVGRIDLLLPSGAELQRGELDIKTGRGNVFFTVNNTEQTIAIELSMTEQLCGLELPPSIPIAVEAVPSEHFLGPEFRSIGIAAPTMLPGENPGGWIQPLPNDPALIVAYRRDGNRLWSVTARNARTTALPDLAAAQLDAAVKNGVNAFHRENRQWWNAYWQDIPAVCLPNEKLAFIYYYGLYKFAGFTNPDGVPATLQGPWIEDHRLPPWSSDYHFNINVQMCYWPAYQANRGSHLLPLFDLVLSWKTQLRQNARYFIGIDDGYMLPHSVDDRCTCMGSFWTGTIDHACSAWIAQMMYRYYRYTGDLAFLRDKAFDFMKGVMRVYEAMLEKKNGTYSLPVSVSPEYRGAEMNAWGANASFQLAAIHRLCSDLIAAAVELHEPVASAWTDIRDHLPNASLYHDGETTRIGLWNGTDLEESHRHHSHLASICPFDTIDFADPAWTEIVNNSFLHWTKQGMGLWSGWCMPWASMLHSRLHNGAMAELILEIWMKVFTNEGHGTLHDVNFPGFSLLGAAPPTTPNQRRYLAPERPYEIMQMDAGMGAVTAVQEMLLHTRQNVIHVFPGAPAYWDVASFSGIPTEGGALFDARITGGKIREITVRALRQTTLSMANPYPGRPLRIVSFGKPETVTSDAVIRLTLAAGKQAIISID